MRKLQEEIIEKCIEKKLSEILTHRGYTNNASLSDGEREMMHILCKDMAEKGYGWVVNGFIIHPKYGSYNNGVALQGFAVIESL